MFDMAGASSTSNFAQAGKAAARENERILQATLENSPNMSKIVQEAAVRRGKENIAALRAETKVQVAGLNEYTATKNSKELGDAEMDYKKSKRKAGVLAAAGGLLGTGIGGLGKSGRKKRVVGEDDGYFDSRIAKNRAKAEEFRTRAAAVGTETDSFSSTVDTPADTQTGKADKTTPAIPTAPGAGSPGSATDFSSVYSMAKNSGAAHPELVAAQWALESDYGKKPSGTNNFFGIKATGSESGTNKQTWEVRGGQDVTETAKFKNFSTPQGSVDHLVNQWHKDYKNYSGVNNAGSAAEAADMLRQEGYATDPAYAEKLKRIMSENGY